MNKPLVVMRTPSELRIWGAPAALIARRASALPLLLTTVLAACSVPHTYDAAFSQRTALLNNSHTYAAPAADVFRAVKISLVQQGFAIEEINAQQGLLKGMRTFDDPKNAKIAYLVTLTVDVSETSPAASVVTAAASQQTVLHRDVHKYYHFLGVLPIPTGKEYQTVVRAEGDITGASFYKDLFAAVSRNLSPSRDNASALQAPGSPKNTALK